jgi:hypothetical protein
MKHSIKLAVASLALAASTSFIGGLAGSASAAGYNCGEALCLWSSINFPGSPNWSYSSTGNAGVNYRSRWSGFTNKKLNRYSGANQTGTGVCMNPQTGSSNPNNGSTVYLGSLLVYASGSRC